jgi:hyperosmotically inducible periplasmic protein
LLSVSPNLNRPSARPAPRRPARRGGDEHHVAQERSGAERAGGHDVAGGLPVNHRQDLGENIDDAGITTAVKAKLAGEKISTVTRIDVDTNRGVVALNGTVKTVEDKVRAEQIARQVKGVRDVVNNLRIQAA